MELDQPTAYTVIPNDILDVLMTLNAATMKVYLALARRCYGNKIECWPKVSTIEAETGLTRRPVFAALEELEHLGLITREKRFRDDGSQSSTAYYLSRGVSHSTPLGATQSTPPSVDFSTPPSAEMSTPIPLKKSKEEENKEEILLGEASPPDSPSEPEKSQKPEKIIPPGVVDVLETLQRVAGRKFTPHGSQAGFVRARLKEGATVAEMALVIEHRAALWMNDPRMRDYLRPQTLFCAKHWEDYLPLAVQWANAGRLSPPNSGAKFVAVKDAASNLLEAMRSGT